MLFDKVLDKVKNSSYNNYRTFVLQGGFNINNLFTKARDDSFSPEIKPSITFKKWYTFLDEKTCVACVENNNKILALNDTISQGG